MTGWEIGFLVSGFIFGFVLGGGFVWDITKHSNVRRWVDPKERCLTCQGNGKLVWPDGEYACGCTACGGSGRR